MGSRPPGWRDFGFSFSEFERSGTGRSLNDLFVRYDAHVTTDKPIYRASDIVRWRAILVSTLQTEQPQCREVRQASGTITLIGPKGDQLHKQEYIQCACDLFQWPFYSDTITISPDWAGGDYTLQFTAPGVTVATRTINIRSYAQPPPLTIVTEFERKGYTAGDQVVANTRVTRREGGIPVGAAVSAYANIDGQAVWDSTQHGAPMALDEQGRVRVTFPLPSSYERGIGTLTVVVDDSGVTGSSGASIPLLLSSLDVITYPTSGWLIDGITSQVFFEAHTPTGEPADIVADVVRMPTSIANFLKPTDGPAQPWDTLTSTHLASVEIITQTSTEHEGRGSFMLTPVREAKKWNQVWHYALRVTQPANIKYPVWLDPIQSSGVSMYATQQSYAVNEPVTVQVSAAGRPAGWYELCLHQHEYALVCERVTFSSTESSPQSTLVSLSPPAHFNVTRSSSKYDWRTYIDRYRYISIWNDDMVGVLRVVLYPNGYRTWGSRPRSHEEELEMLVWRQPPNKLRVHVETSRPGGTTSTDLSNPIYCPRQQINVTVRVMDEAGNPAPSMLAISVVDDSVIQMVETRKQAPRMVSQVYLENQVSALNDAHVYVSPWVTPHPSIPEVSHTSSRPPVSPSRALQLLLSTQGWRRYAYINETWYDEQGRKGNLDAMRAKQLYGWSEESSIAYMWWTRPPTPTPDYENYATYPQVHFISSTRARAVPDMAVPHVARMAAMEAVPMMAAAPRAAAGMARIEKLNAGGPHQHPHIMEQMMDDAPDAVAPAPAPPVPPHDAAFDILVADALMDNTDVDTGKDMDTAPIEKAAAQNQVQQVLDQLKHQHHEPMEEAKQMKKKVHDKPKIRNNHAERHGDGAVRFIVPARPMLRVLEQRGYCLGYCWGNAAREYAHQAQHQHGEEHSQSRSDMTQTVLWTTSRTLKTGVAHFTFDVSDAITSYRIMVDAMTTTDYMATLSHPQHTDHQWPLDDNTHPVTPNNQHKQTQGVIIGQTDALIQVKKPFYIQPSFPFEVTGGDSVILPIALINNHHESISVLTNITATYEQHEDEDSGISPCTFPDAKQQMKQQINLLPKERGRILRQMQVVQTSESNMTLVISSAATTPSTIFRDSISHTFTTVPSGYPVQHSKGGMLPKNGMVEWEIQIPDQDEIIGGPSSIVSHLRLYPSPAANLMQALEALVREPYGCFEQTSATTYPLTMVLQYYRSHTGVAQDKIDRVRNLLEKGYRTLVGYETSSGGFEWFGQTPGHEALTAYGLAQFLDMSKVYAVDRAMIERTTTWMLNRQKQNRKGFERNPRSLDTFGAAPEDITDAYIVWSLAYAGITVETSHIAYLVDLATDGATSIAHDSYFLGLVAGILYQYQDTQRAHIIASKLVGSQQKDGSVTNAHTSITRSGGDSLLVETTSIAVLVWLHDTSFMGNVEMAVRWLVSQCQDGKFGSTQGTVLALKAIIAYDSYRAQNSRESGAVRVFVDGEQVGEDVIIGQASTVDPDPDSSATPTSDPTAVPTDIITLPDISKSLTPGKHTIKLELGGGADIPYSSVLRYHSARPSTSTEQRLSLEFTLKLSKQKLHEGEGAQVHLTLTNTQDKGCGMVTAIIGLPSGLEPRHAQLQELVRAERVAFYETRGRYLILYWRGMAPSSTIQFPIDVVATLPGTYTGQSSQAYPYYHDQQKVFVSPLKVQITPNQ